MKLLQSIFVPLVIICFAAVLRLMPHPANVAPIAAMALFGGAYLSKRYALVVPLIALFLSDLFLGFHSTMVFVYASFFCVGLVGMTLKGRVTWQAVVVASLVSSLLFFVITNFGVWLVSGMYPKSLAGLMECYYFAIPFFRNTIIGDLGFTALFFGGYAVILRTIPQRLLAK